MGDMKQFLIDYDEMPAFKPEGGMHTTPVIFAGTEEAPTNQQLKEIVMFEFIKAQGTTEMTEFAMDFLIRGMVRDHDENFFPRKSTPLYRKNGKLYVRYDAIDIRLSEITRGNLKILFKWEEHIVARMVVPYDNAIRADNLKLKGLIGALGMEADMLGEE